MQSDLERRAHGARAELTETELVWFSLLSIGAGWLVVVVLALGPFLG
jgi:hypothetical protein